MNVDPEASGYWRLEAAASLVRLSPARIRRYVRLGLVRPSRREGKAALFGEVELARLRRIRRLTEDLGLNIAGVEVALRLLDEIEVQRILLRQRPHDRDVDPRRSHGGR